MENGSKDVRRVDLEGSHGTKLMLGVLGWGKTGFLIVCGVEAFGKLSELGTWGSMNRERCQGWRKNMVRSW